MRNFCGSWTILGDAGERGELENELGAFGHLALNADAAAVGFDNLAGRWKAEA